MNQKTPLVTMLDNTSQASNFFLNAKRQYDSGRKAHALILYDRATLMLEKEMKCPDASKEMKTTILKICIIPIFDL